MKKICAFLFLLLISTVGFAQSDTSSLKNNFGYLFEYGIGASYGGDSEGLDFDEYLYAETQLSQLFGLLFQYNIVRPKKLDITLSSGIEMAEFQSSIMTQPGRDVSTKFLNAQIPLLVGISRRNTTKISYEAAGGMVYNLPIEQKGLVVDQAASLSAVAVKTYNQTSIGIRIDGGIGINLFSGMHYRVGSSFYTDITGDIQFSSFLITHQIAFKLK